MEILFCLDLERLYIIPSKLQCLSRTMEERQDFPSEACRGSFTRPSLSLNAPLVSSWVPSDGKIS